MLSINPSRNKLLSFYLVSQKAIIPWSIAPLKAPRDWCRLRQQDHKPQELANMSILPLTHKYQRKPPPSQLVQLASSDLYPPDTKAWLADVRGYDGPIRGHMRCGKFYAAGENRTKAVIGFHRHDNHYTPFLVTGAFHAPPDSGPIFRCIDMQWIRHSQVPCLRLKVIHGPNRTPAFVYIFARDMQPTATARSGCEFACIREADDNRGVDVHPGVKIFFKSSSESTIWETRISIKPDRCAPSDDKSQAPTLTNQLKTTGIDAADLLRIIVAGNLASRKGDWDILSPGYRTLQGLFTSDVFHIYRMRPEGEEARRAYSYFTSYMTQHLNLVAEHGYWPHYRRQAISAGIPFNEFTTDLSTMEPPRHMIQRWRVTCINDIPVQAAPDVWVAFSPLKVYPDVRTKAFALRLEAGRQSSLDRAIPPPYTHHERRQGHAHFGPRRRDCTIAGSQQLLPGRESGQS